MATHTSIEWTATVNPDGTVTPGSTWNPVRGCTKVSPGCARCYAEVFAERFRGVKGHPYEQGFDLRLVPEKLTEPLKWKTPRRVFVNSMSDLFQDGVPFEFIDKAFAVMACAQQHTFQVLTKRPARMLEYMNSRATRSQYWKDAAREVGWALEFKAPNGEMLSLVPFPLPNVWLGVSVENQHFADERIPLLLETPAAVRFVSAEPLLGPINFTLAGHRIPDWDEDWRYNVLSGEEWAGPRDEQPERSQHLDWVIVGGESGPRARPFDTTFARSIVQQCAAAGVACFVKQLGAKPEQPTPGAWNTAHREFLKLANRKGGDPEEWPADLRVRQFPTVRGGA